MSKIIIDGVTKDNQSLLNTVAGKYGYLGLVRIANPTCYSIELLDDTPQFTLDNTNMINEYRALGFDILVVSSSSSGPSGANGDVGFHHMY